MHAGGPQGRTAAGTLEPSACGLGRRRRCLSVARERERKLSTKRREGEHDTTGGKNYGLDALSAI